ncbi:MAG: cupin domain-containing protein [Acidobacteriota bacterium]|nr:cupin domain-containing protein [Acidobacteriota bacterium]
MNDLDPGQLLCVQCDELSWKASTFAAGLFVKDIAVTDGLEMQIVRFEPGARLPVHRHECPEFIYVLEGELILGGERLGPGAASVASKGSVHSDVHSETGCVFVLIDRQYDGKFLERADFVSTVFPCSHATAYPVSCLTVHESAPAVFGFGSA